MARVKDLASVTVIGDLVGSRKAADRGGLHAVLRRALVEINERYGVGARITVGDEYQGTFASLGDALRATLDLRLALLPDADLRHGVGRGDVTVLDAANGLEDGPGWWAARDAIEEVTREASRAATRRLRTAYRPAPDAGGPDPAAVNAALLGRDELVGRLSERSLSVLRGLLSGRTQREIAEAEGVSPSAVSQRVRHDGVGVIVAVTQRLGGLT